LTRRSDSSKALEFQDQRQTSRGKFIKRPLKLLLAMGAFLFFGAFRLRSITWFTFDLWGMYLTYLAGYIGSAVLSGAVNLTQIGYITGQPWLGGWQNASAGSILPFDVFKSTWYLISGIEIIIAVIGIFAVYSTLMLRRRWIAKIGCIALIVAGVLDVASPYPIIESIVGVLAFYVLLRPDVKDAYALKEGTATVPARGGAEEEVTFKADLETPKEKRKTGRRCPKCGLLLPPSANVCRRCKTRIID
jgi:ribosomal protein L40E